MASAAVARATDVLAPSSEAMPLPAAALSFVPCDVVLPPGSDDEEDLPLSDDDDEADPRVRALRASMMADAGKMAGLTDAVASFIAEAWSASAKERAQLQCKAQAQAAADDAKYNACVDWCKANGRYLDTEFPPEKRSLCFDWSMATPGHEDSGVTPLWNEIEWRRPADVLARDADVTPGTKPHVFDGGVAPDDIRQGELGDCYLLSSLSVLAETEKAVERLFVADKESETYGVYVVRLCVQGHWREVIVDEHLPCFPDSQERGQPIFSRGKGPELWVTLVEKAWAKVHGSFQAIVSGLPGECLTNLTGAPCTFLPAAEASLWDKVYEATTLDPATTSKGWFVVALLPEDPEYDLESLGLVAGHAYGVLDARRLAPPRPGDAPVHLLQLRNPWGSFEWTGAYGDNSPAWTPEARAQMAGVDFSAADDGCFWMTVEDFSTYFAGVQICRASRGWHHTSEDVRVHPGAVSVLTLTVSGDVPVALDICLHQEDRRMHKAKAAFEDSDFEYLGLRMMLLHAATGEVMAHWPLTQQRDVWLEAKALPPGQYWVLVETDWDGAARPEAVSSKRGDGAPPHITLGASTLSNGKVELLAPVHCASLSGSLIKEAALRRMCSAARAPTDTVTYDMLFPAAARHARKISKTYYAMRDTFCWFYENKSHKLRLTERVPFELVNMTLDGEPAGATEATVTLEPGQSKLLVLRQTKAGSAIKWFAKPEASLEEVDVSE